MDALTRIDGHADSVGEEARIGIVVASDRASSNEYQDEGGPAILQFLIEATNSPLNVHYRCIPDSMDEIEATLIELADKSVVMLSSQQEAQVLLNVMLHRKRPNGLLSVLCPDLVNKCVLFH